MEEYGKMSEFATTDLRDLQTVKILICYLLCKLKKPVTADQLYDISVSTEIINYFYYQEAVSFLIENNSIKSEKNEKGEDVYTITQKGIDGTKMLENYAPKSYRDKIVTAALRYFARLKYENDVKIEYIESENGYYVHCQCPDKSYDLMDLKLYAPDREQAELIGKNIMKNPVGFYSKILKMTLENKEEEFDPDSI